MINFEFILLKIFSIFFFIYNSFYRLLEYGRQLLLTTAHNDDDIIYILGQQGSGKDTLLQRIEEEDDTTDAINVKYKKIEGSLKQQFIQLMDECSKQNKTNQGVIFMVDLSDLIQLKQSKELAQKLLQDIQTVLQDDDELKVLILANKCDLLREEFIETLDIEHYLDLEGFFLEDRFQSRFIKNHNQPTSEHFYKNHNQCDSERLKVICCSVKYGHGYQEGIMWLKRVMMNNQQ